MRPVDAQTAFGITPGAASTPTSDPSAALIADILTDGLDDALGKLIADYLGERGAKTIRARRHPSDCREIAAAAKSLLSLKKSAHEITGEAVANLLPPSTPPFVRTVTAKLGEKIPLAGETELLAVVRGLQALGIFICMVQGLPPARCPCLLMIGEEVGKAVVREEVRHLIEAGRRDLRGRPFPEGPAQRSG